MATTRGEYSTVSDISTAYLSIVATTDNTMMLDLLRSVCRDIDKAAGQQFYPLVETRYFDYGTAARHSILMLDKPLLAVTTLTNGDATVVSASSYVFEPRNANEFPKWKIKLLSSAGLSWQFQEDYENAISLAGVWGYHDDYNAAWEDSLATLAVAISSPSATTFTCTTGLLKAGWLIKIDSEYMYVSSVATGASDTATVLRGVNGSTATTHLISTAIYWWKVSDNLAQLAKEATVARYRLRGNPLADTFVALDGTTFVSLKDVDKYIVRRVNEMGMARLPIG